MKLLVVESPNKIKKIRSLLDKWEPGQWEVVATVGHWRGLPPMQGQAFEDVTDPANGFREKFVILEGKEDVVSRLKSAIAKAGEIYLGSDNDREGEAIAWHVADYFGLREAKRSLANEITEKGIIASIRNAVAVDENLVSAQRARSVLDYLIGMEVSRMLWRFGAKSAGRLQSCALRIVVERERRIRGFVSTPWWRLEVAYNEGFTATLGAFEKPSQDELDSDENAADEPRLVSYRFINEDEAKRALAALSGAQHIVESVETKPFARHPPSPFTTADLLGTAASRLQFGAETTTKLAQSLFEKGIVTYIRTDSTALSDEAVFDIRAYLGAHYGELLPLKSVAAKQSKNAQAAHEAIRPTHMTRAPECELSAEEQQLYDLIFERTLCSQAKAAQFEKTTVTIAPSNCDFRLLAHGSVVVDPGWMKLTKPDAIDPNRLPLIANGQELHVAEVRLQVGKTKPPPRFNERALIRYLERRGIGRPSTYVSMLSTLKARGYIREEKRALIPEDLGLTADELVQLGFGELSQEDFTAKTELALDAIAAGKLPRELFLRKFYEHFSGLQKSAISKFDAYAREHPAIDRNAVVPYEKPCAKCGSAMMIRIGKNGRFARCAKDGCGYTVNLEPPRYNKRPCPQCGGKVVEQPYVRDEKRKTLYRCESDPCGWKSSYPPPRVSKSPCPKCGGRLLLRSSSKGEFWSCAKFPECNGTAPYVASRKPKRPK